MTDQKNKPVLDEQTFDKLLESAYVLQEHGSKMRELEEKIESHSERLREQEAANEAAATKEKNKPEESSRSNGDYTLTLAEIVEAQRQIQARHLELGNAMAVVSERVSRITGATGAAIGILDGKMVRYRAGAGTAALPLDSMVPLATAICAASVRTGQVIRSEDVNTEVLFDPEPCRQRGILSLLAVPIYHDGDIVGALELYFDKIHGYAEQDIHTCQLMAGLVTEAIGRDAQSTLKKSMAAERSTMLATIEQLQPNPAASVKTQSVINAAPNPGGVAEQSQCWKCGNQLAAEELFCGKCGAHRAVDDGPSSMQSKLASAWHNQQTGPEPFRAPHESSLFQEPASSLEASRPIEADLPENNSADRLQESFSVPELKEDDPLAALSFDASADDDEAESQPSEPQPDEESIESPSTALVKPEQQDVVWSSAARARDFLESLSEPRAPGALARFWRSRRGDFYLAIAVILVVAVIVWGVRSNHSVGAANGTSALTKIPTRVKRPAPDADLSTFDKLLIGLGLADPPEATEYKGNPDTQVWVDFKTALYYCPGSDLYGKTAKGKLSSQRDAQLDQFEPAYRKACD